MNLCGYFYKICITNNLVEYLLQKKNIWNITLFLMFSCLEKNQYKNHQKEKANSITHAINKIKKILILRLNQSK